MQVRRDLELILYKTYADLRAEAARSYLGLLWWIIEPMLYLCAFYILFVLILRRGDPDFVPTFLCGAVAWKWFDNGVKAGGNSIRAHSGLLQQIYIPKYVFPVIAVLGGTARFIFVFVVLMIFLRLYGVPIRPTWAAAVPVMLVQLCLTLSLAMLVSAVTPFLPDLKVAIDNGMMLLFFISGVFFDINTASEPLRTYLLANPMAGLIREYRNVMIEGIWPDVQYLGLSLLFSVIVGAMALMLLKHFDHRYGKVRF